MLKEYKNDIKKFFIENSKMLVLLSVVYYLAYFSIIRANYYYLDDMTRTATGIQGWDYFSRYISVWLSTIIHCDNYLSDVAPLTQFLAIIILSLSGILTVKIITGRNAKPIDLVAVLPMGLVPYFLECISYRFDSPYMALSILASVFPCAFYKDKNQLSDSIVYVFAGIVGTLVVCMTYQAASGIFPMLVVVVCAKRIIDNDDIKSVLKFAGLSAFGYLIALIIFKYLIMVPVSSYVTTYQAPAGNIISTTVNNLKQYFSAIIRDFKFGWKLTILIIVAIYICICTIQSKINKFIALIVGIISAAVMLLMSFGAYAMLEKSIFNPRAMYGFGSFLAFLAVYICAFDVNSFKFVPRVACAVLGWMFISFSFTYGNCLYAQAQYTDFRARLIISDLNEIEDFCSSDTLKYVNIHGDIGLSPIVQKINFGPSTMLKSLIPETLSGSEGLKSRGFYYFYGLKNVVEYNGAFDDADMNLPLIKDTMYHTIYCDGEYFVVEIK